jgi:hypothetical protein
MDELKSRIHYMENKENKNVSNDGDCKVSSGKCKKCETLIIANGEMLKKMKRLGRQGSQLR